MLTDQSSATSGVILSRHRAAVTKSGMRNKTRSRFPSASPRNTEKLRGLGEKGEGAERSKNGPPIVPGCPTVREAPVEPRPILRPLKSLAASYNPLIWMVAAGGFEPPTKGL